MVNDIRQLGQRGAGGIEFLNYFNYGGAQGPPPEEVDWSIYGYATSAYLQVLEAALQAIKDNGMIMDFCPGPQSGQGVPAEPDEIGLAWELVSSNTSFASEYHGQVPGWESGILVSLSAFNIVDVASVPALAKPETNKTEYTISAPSLVDLTSLVTPNGSVSFHLNHSNAADSAMLFASYARRSYARANIPSSNKPQNILQNGSFAVDHFSLAGARLTTSFLETYVVQPNSTIKSLLEHVGNYFWEDSPEIPAPVYWTPDLLATFQRQHGYDLREYVPFLFGFNGDLMVNEPSFSIVSDSERSSTVVNDFRTTLTGLYKEYLETLQDWSRSYLNMDFSAQIGYNLPVDMLSAIPSAGVPETETLSFLNNIDAFRQFSGPANLAGRMIVSIELGADYGQSYLQPLAMLIEEASRAYAVGINQVVIHGASYSGFYPQTTYPGFTTFGYNFAAMHSRHQPAWNLGYKSMLDWLARAQFLLQSGTPKVDLVFWDKQTAQDPFPDTLYWSTDLTDAGYSYTYLSPDNFALPTAVVGDGVFAPETLGASVLILRHNDTLTAFGIQKLIEYAHAGLKVIIEGDIPRTYATPKITIAASANSTLESILRLPNVHRLGASDSDDQPASLASFLVSLGVYPRISVQANETWYTRYISSLADSSVVVFVFSDATTASEGMIRVQSTGKPFFLDLWNGVESPILEYTVDHEDESVTIPLKMAASQAIMIQFKERTYIEHDFQSRAPEVHVTNAPKNVLGYAYDAAQNSSAAKVGRSTSSSSNVTEFIVLSDNSTVDIKRIASSVPQAFDLSSWTLLAEKWLPPSNLSDIDGVVKEQVTVEIKGSEIAAWPYLEGLANSSGIGTYTTNFNWPPSSYSKNHSSLGAFLQIPATDLIQGLSASINDHALPHADLMKPTFDISSHLNLGSNSLSINISTSLWNSLRPVWSQLMTGGIGPQLSIEALLMSPQTAPLAMELPVGLAGIVQIIPYESVRIN